MSGVICCTVVAKGNLRTIAILCVPYSSMYQSSRDAMRQSVGECPESRQVWSFRSTTRQYSIEDMLKSDEILLSVLGSGAGKSSYHAIAFGLPSEMK